MISCNTGINSCVCHLSRNWVEILLCETVWIEEELVIVRFIKVKNDHRSKFSNLSNWKEEA